jgi:hypothetical protein
MAAGSGLKYRFGGKEKLLALGGYPEVSLNKRWEYRDAARQLLKAEKDPATERKRQSAMPASTLRTLSSRNQVPRSQPASCHNGHSPEPIQSCTGRSPRRIEGYTWRATKPYLLHTSCMHK